MPYTIKQLTPQQLAEFASPKLESFALAYLQFAHSSPCTAKHTVFPYFEPLPENKLTDNEILYGMNRETAYKNLMIQFDVCKISGEFEKLFQDKMHFWKSRTIPGLIILKAWL